MFYVNAYTYIPTGQSRVVQGIKGGRRPKNAFYGGNGSYRVGEKAKAILIVTDDDNNTKEIDIAPTLRKIAFQHGTKLSSTKAITFCSSLVNTSIEENRGYINADTLDEIWNKVIE